MIAERFAVIGHPIAHSLSPPMQSAAFQSAGIAAVYEAHDVSPEMLAGHVDRLRREYRGFNVTVPHKEAIMRTMDSIDPDAEAIGAINTVLVRHGELHGFNTDGIGFLAALGRMGFEPSYREAVVLGTGGSARAVAFALGARQAHVTVAGRTVARARAAFLHPGENLALLGMNDPEMVPVLARAELIVNTTPLGMAPQRDQSPLPSGCELRQGAVAFDLVYGHDTPFLAQARASGCAAVDGLEMLVQQGAEAFRLWTGVEPDVDAMRAACRRALGVPTCSAF